MSKKRTIRFMHRGIEIRRTTAHKYTHVVLGRLDEARYREYYRGRGPITEASEQWFDARVARGDYRLAAQAWCSRLDLAK